MDSLAKDLVSDFSKKEILAIAEELDLEFSSRVRSSEIVNSILEDMDENGIPVSDECSELLTEFLIAAEYIDDGGNVVEDGGDEDSKEGSDEKEEEMPAEPPPCFGFADERDPACKRCNAYSVCMEERLATRPECFGRLFSAVAEECKVCIEASPCELAMSKSTK